MNDNFQQRQAAYRQLMETAWRRPLSPAEQAALQDLLGADPALRQEWAREQALNTALGRLPEAPVPSNFTARVMQSVARETSPSPASAGLPARQALWSRLAGWMGIPWSAAPVRHAGAAAWLWRGAAAAVLVLSGVGSFQHFESAQRQQLATSVATVSGISALPPDILQDFDAIQALSPNPGADEQLLAAMTQ